MEFAAAFNTGQTVKICHQTRAHPAGFHSESGMKPENPPPPRLRLTSSQNQSVSLSLQDQRNNTRLFLVLEDASKSGFQITVRHTQLQIFCFALTCVNVWRCCYCCQVWTLGNILTSWNSFIAALPGNSPHLRNTARHLKVLYWWMYASSNMMAELFKRLLLASFLQILQIEKLRTPEILQYRRNWQKLHQHNNKLGLEQKTDHFDL